MTFKKMKKGKNVNEMLSGEWYRQKMKNGIRTGIAWFKKYLKKTLRLKKFETTLDWSRKTIIYRNIYMDSKKIISNVVKK